MSVAALPDGDLADALARLGRQRGLEPTRKSILRRIAALATPDGFRRPGTS